MTLFGFPFSCSFAVHLMLEQHGHTPDLRWTGRGPDRRPANEQLTAVNAKRRVPALVLDDGTVLTEVVSVLDYLDERFVPSVDLLERRQRLQWLAFVATDLHQPVLAPLFDKHTHEVTRKDAVQRLLPVPLAFLADHLEGREYVLDRPSSVDAYVLWALILLRNGAPEAVSAPSLQAYLKRGFARSEVRRVIGRERAAVGE